MGSLPYILYDQTGVEPPLMNEQDLTNGIVSLVNSTQQQNYSMHRHYMRGTHVKTQAIVKGTLTISSNLPVELAQGVASPQNAKQPHPIAIRYANEPSWLQDD